MLKRESLHRQMLHAATERAEVAEHERDDAIQRAEAAERQIELEREAMRGFHRAYNESITASSIKYREAVKRAEVAEREAEHLREQVKIAHDALMVAAGYIAFRVEMTGANPETNQSYRIVAKAIAALDGSGGQREE